MKFLPEWLVRDPTIAEQDTDNTALSAKELGRMVTGVIIGDSLAQTEHEEIVQQAD